jgi:molybdopterin/thiamine biosynthesis adenylyltransferase
MRYERNFIYISPAQQEKIKNTRILLGGVGIGSVIAETALRLGFENFILVDADEVELSNLNRQNYLHQDIGAPKVEALANRLVAINPDIKVRCYQEFLSEENTLELIKDCHIAINAIDFASDAPFMFDEACRAQNIPVIHPHNFGWAGGAYVVMPNSSPITDFSTDKDEFEYKVAMHIIEQSRNKYDLAWFDDFAQHFLWCRTTQPDLSPSQLSVGSGLAASIVSHILFALVNDLPVKTFPDFYFLSTR